MPPATATESELGAQAVGLLRRLIAFDTVNPPGRELVAQEHLRSLLEPAGFECRLLAREEGRPNLVARLRGRREGPTLCLLGHVDTVRADPEEWARDPWSADLVDGEIWGRGALDMKGQVAAEVAACVHLAGAGWRPDAGDLLLVATADEETGAANGARWLCAEHPDLVACDLVVNEGGGGLFEFGERRLHTVCVGEKGVHRFQLVTHGRAGHASQPRIGENALLAMAPLLERIAARQPPLEPSPEVAATLSVLLGEDVPEDAPPERLAEVLERVRATAPRLADILVEPLLGVTLVPTMARASEKENVIPSRCEVLVDCRVPPGGGEEHARESVLAVLGEGDYELRFVESVTGSSSPLDTELMDTIERWLERADPEAELCPMVLPGFSDSHWFRSMLGATAYGFFPHRSMDLLEAAPLVHGANERIPVADVELAAGCYADLVRAILGDGEGA